MVSGNGEALEYSMPWPDDKSADGKQLYYRLPHGETLHIVCGEDERGDSTEEWHLIDADGEVGELDELHAGLILQALDALARVVGRAWDEVL